MLQFKLKPLFLYIIFGSVLVGCNNSVNSYSPSETKSLKKHSAQEKEALEALTQLQLNADIKNSIYLTFGNTNHNQLPSDSSFTISKETFRAVLFDYTKIHHINIPYEKRKKWVEASVKGKNTYQVYYCRDKAKKALIKNKLPYSGTWILPDVLNKDIVIIWRRLWL